MANVLLEAILKAGGVDLEVLCREMTQENIERGREVYPATELFQKIMDGRDTITYTVTEPRYEVWNPDWPCRIQPDTPEVVAWSRKE